MWGGRPAASPRTTISLCHTRGVPETPEQVWERSRDALRMPPVHEWDTWPFDGELRPKTLLPPLAEEPPRSGEPGVPCWRCDLDPALVIWSDGRWLVHSHSDRGGLPVVVMLQTHDHVDFHELDDSFQAELGPLLVRVERAVASVPGVGRVHVCKWGDGTAHVHFWFLARPARLPQLKGSFAAIWDDVLPPTPAEVWKENLAIVQRALTEAGTTE